MLVYISKVIEGIAASFIGPCIAALTLASFGPKRFDKIMASNILWGHVGSVVAAAATVAGAVAFFLYPNVKCCFLVLGAAALFATMLIPQLPQGDRLTGRGFRRNVAFDENGVSLSNYKATTKEFVTTKVSREHLHTRKPLRTPRRAYSVSRAFSFSKSYLKKSGVRKLTFALLTCSFANANVLLVLGELMGQGEEGIPSRSSLPLLSCSVHNGCRDGHWEPSDFAWCRP